MGKPVKFSAVRWTHRKAPERLTVELVGIPGAGKSRLAQALATDLTDRGLVVAQPQAPLGPTVPTCPRLLRKAGLCARAPLVDPATSSRVIRGVVGSGQPGPAEAARRVVQWLVAQHVMAAAADQAGVSIVDEGPVQCLWSIGLRGDVEPMLAAVGSSRLARSADLLVVVRVPAHVAVARLAARTSQHSRTQLLPSNEHLAELERGARLIDRLVDWWSKGAQRSGQVVQVSGAEHSTRDLEMLLTRICTSPSAARR